MERVTEEDRIALSLGGEAGASWLEDAEDEEGVSWPWKSDTKRMGSTDRSFEVAG